MFDDIGGYMWLASESHILWGSDWNCWNCWFWSEETLDFGWTSRTLRKAELGVQISKSEEPTGRGSKQQKPGDCSPALLSGIIKHGVSGTSPNEWRGTIIWNWGIFEPATLDDTGGYNASMRLWLEYQNRQWTWHLIGRIHSQYFCSPTDHKRSIYDIYIHLRPPETFWS